MPAGQSPKKALVLPKVLKKCIKHKKKVFSYFLIIHLSRKSLAQGGNDAAMGQECTDRALAFGELQLLLGNNLRSKLVSLPMWLQGAEPSAVSEL